MLEGNVDHPEVLDVVARCLVGVFDREVSVDII